MKRQYFLRALGRVLVVDGIIVLLTVLLLWLWPGWLSAAGVVVSTILLVATAMITVSVLLPPALLQLDGYGFRALKKQSVGRPRGLWTDVDNVATQEGERGPLLMLTHRDGTFSGIPLDLLEGDVAEVEADVRRRLDDAHGYKRLT